MLKKLFIFFILFFCSPAWADLTLTNNFVGIIDPAILTNVKERLKVKQATIPKLTIDSIKIFYEEAPFEIGQAVEPYGFFHSKINSKITNLGEKWLATYYVKLGPPVIISDISYQLTGPGANDQELIDFFKKFPIHKGSILNLPFYKQTKQELFDLATKNGYLSAKMIKSEVQIDRNNNTSRITLLFDTGPRYFFGPIAISKTNFNDKFINKFIIFKQGENYSGEKIKTTQANLTGSNLFRGVIVEPQYQEAKNLQVPVIIKLIPRRSQQYNFGAGFGTDTGIRGLLGIELYNLTSNGQYFTGLIKASAESFKNFEGDLEAHYIIPGPNPLRDQFDISVATKLTDQNYGQSTLIKGGPGYTTTFSGWQQSIRLDLEHEWWKFTPNGIDADTVPFSQSTLLVPNISWTKRVVNDPINPTRGYRINFLLQGTGKLLGSDINFWQAKLDTKVMYPIPKGPLLILRATLGYTGISDEDLNNLPLSFWFTAGGADSIRAYGYNGIGPGKELAVGSIELRQKLFVNELYGGVFFDIGNAGNNIFQANSDDPFYQHQSVGFGFTYLSPVGALRLTYARAIDLPGAPSRIQFSMGPDL